MMPKDLWQWLNFQTSKWQMTGTAHKLRHGGIWHRFQGELPGWSDCGTWMDVNLVKASAGKGCEYPSPFAYTGSIDLYGLCRRCFAAELPLLAALHQEQWNRSNPEKMVEGVLTIREAE